MKALLIALICIVTFAVSGIITQVFGLDNGGAILVGLACGAVGGLGVVAVLDS